MARIARVVAEGLPHHITQRGNRRQDVFSGTQDRRVYLSLLKEYAGEYGLRVSAWCLMSNDVHLLAVPETAEALARTLGRTHCDYARYRNARQATCGHLWQARYYSCPVDTSGIWPVMAYIERNPIRARIVASAEDYAWSSARAHAGGEDASKFLDMVQWRQSYTAARWRDILRLGVEEEAFIARLRLATMTGRPFGSDQFVEALERSTNRRLRPLPRGPRKCSQQEDEAEKLAQLMLETGG